MLHFIDCESWASSNPDAILIFVVQWLRLSLLHACTVLVLLLLRIAMAVPSSTTTNTIDMTDDDLLDEMQLREYREELEALGNFPVCCLLIGMGDYVAILPYLCFT